MKHTNKILSAIAAILITLTTIAQSPQAFKYQAVVRDNTGEILQNGDVGIRMSIHDSVADGTIVYQETFFQITSQFGLVNIEIGNGTPSIGIFEDISWGNNPKFLETEIDPTGGSNFVSMGTSELLSVPYALYSASSGDTSIWNQIGDDIYYENGKVGIGTDSPYVDLDIRSISPTLASRLLLGNSDVSKTLFLNSGDEIYDPYISFSGSDALNFSKHDSSFNILMTIKDDGKVGIGTTSPTTNLDIRSDSPTSASKIQLGNSDISNTLYFYSGNGTYEPYISFSGSDALRFAKYDEGLNELMRINEDGKVGIGTIVPRGELQINDPFDWEGITYNGIGPNDLHVDYDGYSGTSEAHYIVEVTSFFNTPDIIKWSNDNGATWVEDVAMQTYRDKIDVGYDVYIYFDRVVGHRPGEQWSWTVSERQDDVFIVKGGMVGIGTEAPDASAALDIKSTEKGMLIPRMAQTEIATIENPANGLQAFNTDNSKLYIYVLGAQEWKEVQYGSGTISSESNYTIGTGGACANTVVNGTYGEGVDLNSSNTVSLDVNVTSIGNWEISTNTVNDYSFSGSGAFTSTGTHQVSLIGTGTPAIAQTDSFTVTANNGGGTCTFDVSVTTTVYSIGTWGSCANTIVNGNYYESVPLNGSNTVSLEAMVTTPGPWSISTNGSGFSFSGSGTFTSTGTVQVTLNGSGTPTQTGTANFTATANDNNGTCTFSVSVDQPFICGSSLTYGGQNYNTVLIGSQCWMAENLNIGIEVGALDAHDNGIIEKTCYDGSTSNCDTYGGLYWWGEMMDYTTDNQGICPTDWHVPTNAEWCILENYVDAGTIDCDETGFRGTDAGGNLKETGTAHWASPNTGATNSSGFSALPGGRFQFSGGIFHGEVYFAWINTSGTFWSSTLLNDAIYHRLSYEDARVEMDNGSHVLMSSVRCLRDY